MSSQALPVPRGRRHVSAAALAARLRGWWTPTDARIAWTIGPDGMPCAQWIVPTDAAWELR